MRNQKRRLLSAVLSATTIMSMLTSVTAVAADNVSVDIPDDVITKVSEQGKAVSNQQASTAVAVDNNVNQQYYGATGDRTLEYERPDDIIVINSASEYYKLTGKKYKVPSGGSLKSSLPSSVD
ncbi:MAG: hypothetical protein UD936_06480, partial [Acutalibacteraceae bacterium]|nr:hypothetical protein [Acutalibacteraceae bacterium]